MICGYGLAVPAVFLAVLAGVAIAADDARNAAVERGEHLDAERLQQGMMLYNTHCLHCHGINMVSPGTIAYDLREFPRDQAERFFKSVTNGKDNRMPPWGDVLTQEEIGEIWVFVLSRTKS
jgi:cytochrome c55X